MEEEKYLDIRGEIPEERDTELEKRLRPPKFNEFRGQQGVVENLKVFVQAAKNAR